MKIRIKLYGTLPGRFADYHAAKGLQLQLNDDACLQDLFVLLKLAESGNCFATVDGRVVKTDETLSDGSWVHIFQRVFGG